MHFGFDQPSFKRRLQIQRAEVSEIRPGTGAREARPGDRRAGQTTCGHDGGIAVVGLDDSGAAPGAAGELRDKELRGQFT